jgi:hemerythrin
MEWSDSLSIGIDEIDKQHMQLVAIIGNFQRKFGEKDRYLESVMGQTINYLVRYTRFHFDMEESFMKSISYPDLENHKLEHRKLLEELTSVLVKLRGTKAYTPVEFYYFLTRWATEHIAEKDKMIGTFFKEQFETGIENEKVAHNPDEIVDFIKQKLLKIETMHKYGFISEEQLDSKRFDFLSFFFSQHNLTKHKAVYTLLNSIDILEQNKMITASQSSELNKVAVKTLDMDHILSRITDDSEKEQFKAFISSKISN